MSVEVLLVPLAFAAIKAWQANRSDTGDPLVCQVSTRMRDVTLLSAALSDLGAEVTCSEAELTARWPDLSAQFARGAEGIWTAHVSGTEVDEARALDLVTRIDAAYGRRVQAAVLERIRDRAKDAGLQVESEVRDAEENVTLVLTVGQG